MNEERFRELARQAGVLIDWGEDIKVGRWGIGGNYKNMQKFAELIVQVNIQTLRSHGYDDAAQVLQDIYFGIEDPV
jgi:uroporphyrinogen-III decarboxylase